MEDKFIKEKCGVLAIVPRTISNLSIKNIILNLTYENSVLRAEKINRWNSQISLELLDKFFVFATFLEKLNHRGYDGYGYSINIDGVIYNDTFDGSVSITDLVDSMVEKYTVVVRTSESSVRHNIRYLVGHVRYCTSGEYDKSSHQPYVMSTLDKSIGICFNGNIIDGCCKDSLRRNDTGIKSIKCHENKESNIYGNSECIKLLSYFEGCSTNTDSMVNNVLELRSDIKGAFSAIVFDEKSVYGFRDKRGIRPLVYYANNDLVIISSESCVAEGSTELNQIDFKTVLSKEIICIDSDKRLVIKDLGDKCSENLCLFEYIYFSDPKSQSFDKCIADYRKDLGRLLGEKELLGYKEIAYDMEPLDAIKNSVVIHVPKSSYFSSKGFAEATGIECLDLINKSGYYKRSFIQKKDRIVDTLKTKFEISDINLEGKKVYLVDDSLVRGNTMLHIVNQIRNLGALEINIRIPSPMIKSGCNLGICTVDQEIICRDKSLEELCEYFNVESIKFLEIDEIRKKFGDRFCSKCFYSD